MSVNKAIISGYIGKDPETRHFDNGGMIVSFSVATSERWKDRTTGEQKEQTEWHNISVKGKHSAEFAEKYLKKGDLVYVEGKIKTRSWEKDGHTFYTTEIVVDNFNCELKILKKSGNEPTDDLPF